MIAAAFIAFKILPDMLLQGPDIIDDQCVLGDAKASETVVIAKAVFEVAVRISRHGEGDASKVSSIQRQELSGCSKIFMEGAVAINYAAYGSSRADCTQSLAVADKGLFDTGLQGIEFRVARIGQH